MVDCRSADSLMVPITTSTHLPPCALVHAAVQSPLSVLQDSLPSTQLLVLFCALPCAFLHAVDD
jgi:hypothetical protein